MYAIAALSRIVHHDARIEVKVPASQGRKAYSYFREGAEGEQGSSRRSSRKIAAGVGGAITAAGLAGLAAILLGRKKLEGSDSSPISVGTKSPASNSVRNRVAAGAATGVGAGLVALAVDKRKRKGLEQGDAPKKGGSPKESEKEETAKPLSREEQLRALQEEFEKKEYERGLPVRKIIMDALDSSHESILKKISSASKPEDFSDIRPHESYSETVYGVYGADVGSLPESMRKEIKAKAGDLARSASRSMAIARAKSELGISPDDFDSFKSNYEKDREGTLNKSPSKWSAEMDEQNATSWASGSSRKEPFFHGTSAESAEAIRKDGFNLHSVATARAFGDAVYTASDVNTAKGYGQAPLELRVNIKNIYDLNVTKIKIASASKGRSIEGEDYDLFAEAASQEDSKFQDTFLRHKKMHEILYGNQTTASATAFTRTLADLGYDAMECKAPGYMMVLNPKNIVVVKPNSKGKKEDT